MKFSFPQKSRLNSIEETLGDLKNLFSSRLGRLEEAVKRIETRSVLDRVRKASEEPINRSDAPASYAHGSLESLLLQRNKEPSVSPSKALDSTPSVNSRQAISNLLAGRAASFANLSQAPFGRVDKSGSVEDSTADDTDRLSTDSVIIEDAGVQAEVDEAKKVVRACIQQASELPMIRLETKDIAAKVNGILREAEISKQILAR